ncbi:MAG: HAD-IIIA family hydrolase [Rhodospirillaceae bacterium]|nr:HAD-IIIA family hydrolase [Rhodospirillaceae bacterium]MBT5244331.1 HAD-IIIA family hydrolase [Rhodospirillaceae bacterium]MBT5563692.1 HAD-IIIA family hydrolase [Rhodospirillaceae bacterium]MBT6241522.1 HAD-IIIA family hydrolase [Rhodospirillaceae bacterium]MBT7137062.1 HAD-IIIA family hydrolase [Rhodospirillaceae bacterium]
MIDSISLPDGAKLADGVFHQILRPEETSKPRPALFLDRDGCVVAEAHYLHKAEDVDLIAGAADVIARANTLEIAVVFVTNQAGVGYGYFGWQDFFQVQNEILGRLTAGGAKVDGVYACPFHEKAKPPYDHPDHPSRKPNPGMLMAAAAEMNLDLGRSWIIGDRAGDLEAGLNAGIAGGVHVATGHGTREGEREAALDLKAKNFQALAASSIAEAPQLIGLFS